MINIQVDKSEKCNGQYSLYITFPYNKYLVDKVKELTIRYWHPDTKEWEVPIKSYNKLLDAFKGFEINIDDNDEIIANFNFER